MTAQTQIQPYLEAIVDTKTRAVLQSVTIMIDENQAAIHQLTETVTEMSNEIARLNNRIETLELAG